MQKKLIFLIFFLILPACNTSFQIKPRQEVSLSQPSNISSSAIPNTTTPLQAQLLSEDKVVEVFDANLFLSGVLPVQISFTNNSQEFLTLQEKDFTLLDLTGRRFSNIKAKDVLNRVFDYYGITAYNIYSYETMKTNFLSHSIVLNEAIKPGETRQGLLYFKFEKRSSIPKGLKIKLEGKKLTSQVSEVTSSTEPN